LYRPLVEDSDALFLGISGPIHKIPTVFVLTDSPSCFAEIMGNSVDMKKLRARVGGRRDLAAELQAGKRKRNEASESSEASTQKDSSDHGPSDAVDAGHTSPSHVPTLPTFATADIIPGSVAPKITPEVINLEGSSEGGAGSLPERATNQPSTDIITRAPITSSGPVRLDHLSVTSLGIQSNWHVNRQAKDLSQVYPYDVDLMAKVGGVGCFEAGSIMLARCLAIMQHHCQVAEGEVGLRDRLVGLERQVEGLSKVKEALERDVFDLKEANAGKDVALAEKESELIRLQEVCERKEIEAGLAEQKVKTAESRVTELQGEMAKQKAEWEDKKRQLEQACVEVYEDGFLKAMRQATALAPDLDPSLFVVDEDDVHAADPISTS